MLESWVYKLNESNSRLHKESVLQEVLNLETLGDENCKMFLKLIHLTYNPFFTFGVTTSQITQGVENEENPWDDFVSMLSLLNGRNLTGNAAHSAIQTMSYRFNSSTWNDFCVNVINKDLRCGISDKTINKIVKNTKYEIPMFGCQLATDSEGRPEMCGRKRLEPKLDGVRVLMICIPTDVGVTVTSYSRNGKVFENFSHIENQIKGNWNQIVRNIASSNVSMGLVLDGEVMGESFQALMRQARRKENANASDSVYHIFDLIPLNDFNRGYWNAQLFKRINMLNDIREIIDTMPNVELLPSIKVDLDLAEGVDQLHRYANDCVAQGYEGIMIKSLDAPYECKRNRFWLKWKPTITVDLEVIGVEEGTGRNVGRLGALVCQGIDNEREITVNVGSGFSDIDRNEFYINRNIIIGRTVEILSDAITQNQDGSYSLRFPRFLRFRDDK